MAAVRDLITPRRLVGTAVLLLAAVITIYGLQHVKTSGSAASCGAGDNSASPIKKLFPCPGDTQLRQARVGVSLADGYTADLFVDGLLIPKEAEIIEGSNFYYQPGPGTVTGPLVPGVHILKIDYYQLLQAPADGTVYSWNFTAR
jgi:hypothetical protein